MSIRPALNFIRRYKILHVLFWSYSILAYLHERQEYFGGTLRLHLIPALMVKSFQMIGVYVSVCILVPVYLNNRKYFQFILSMIGVVIACGIINAYLVDSYATTVSGVHERNMFATSVSLMVDILIITSVFVAITIIISRYESDQMSKKLEKNNLEIELNFLKAQINPHFLLNTLNTIYYKIDKQNAEARDILMKFSDMLKYQLYESNSGMVSIDKELEYLKNYVNLQRVRLNEDYAVHFNHDDTLSGFEIPQHLFIPFVENAFKHVSHFEDSRNEISINMSKQDQQLCLEVYNTRDVVEISDKPGGIGLPNVKRRLRLLFPDRHQLLIDSTKKTYTVSLKISLS